MNPAIGLAKRLGPEEPQLSSLGGTPDFWKYQRWSSQTRCAFDQIKATPPTVQNRDLGKKPREFSRGPQVPARNTHLLAQAREILSEAIAGMY